MKFMIRKNRNKDINIRKGVFDIKSVLDHVDMRKQKKNGTRRGYIGDDGKEYLDSLKLIAE